MKRLAVISLAASALLPLSAAAAQSTVKPPVPWEDVPDARLKVPASPAPRTAPAPGVSWQQPQTAPMPRVQTRVAPAPQPAPRVAIPRPAPQVAAPPIVHPVPHARVAPAPHVGPEAPVRFEMRRRVGDGPVLREGHGPIQRDVIIHRRGDRGMVHHRGINNYPHYRRIDRGLMLPHHWWGPQFHVMNWGMYGLPQPMHGGRWVRYYDDALLVDGHGRVHDGRWGMKWDEYGDRWSHDDRGIPVYVGNGDYHPDNEDYARVEEHGGAPRPGSGYHQSYAYPGYAYGGMIVTETTVTTSPTVVQTTVYEDVVQPTRRHRAKRVRSKTRCIC